jgi:hypothetical protein
MRTMTVEKDILIGLACIIVTAGIVLFFEIRGINELKGSYSQELKAKQDSINALGVQKTRYQLEADSILRRQTALETEAASDRQALLTQRQLYQATIQQYEKLARYDTIGAADIQRYLSDSLP